MEVTAKNEALKALLDHEYKELTSAFSGSHKFSDIRKLVSRMLAREICKDIGLRWFNLLAYIDVKSALFDRLLADLELGRIISYGNNPKTGRRERMSPEHWAFARRNRALIRQPGNSIILTGSISDSESVTFNDIDLVFTNDTSTAAPSTPAPPVKTGKRPGRKIRDDWAKVAAIACRRVHDGGLPKLRTELVEDILAIQDALQLDEPYKEDRIEQLVDAIFDEFQRKPDLYDETKRR